MALPEFLPWQRTIASKWLSERERFAHAWLIQGLAGIGKRQFALAAAGALLCESPRKHFACGQCPACQWLSVGSHPDLRRIRPDAIAALEGETDNEDASGSTPVSGSTKKTLSCEIRVDQLRKLHTWFNTATHRGGFRVAVLYPAEALNAISANAMLKVLEEPPEKTIFLLVSDTPDRLLPTLLSRCRRLPLAVPQTEVAKEWLADQGLDAPESWLAAAGGAPLRALALSSELEVACPAWLNELARGLAGAHFAQAGPIADALEKQAPAVWVDNLQRWFVDLLLATYGMPVRYFPQLSDVTGKVAVHVSTTNLSEMTKWLAQQKAVANHPLNAKLLAQTTVQRVVLACKPAA